MIYITMDTIKIIDNAVMFVKCRIIWRFEEHIEEIFHRGAAEKHRLSPQTEAHW